MKHKHFFSFITAVIMMFSSFSLLPTKNIIPIKANALDSHIESALQWAVNIANDNSHGYSQTSRWGPDYDCSSLVISALKQAGIDVGSASWTGEMRANLTAHGFTWIPWSSLGGSGNLQRGDILLNELYHTEFCLSSTQLVGANSNRGYSQTGDQTGTEIYIKNYFDYSSGWDGILRYTDVTKPTNVTLTKNQYWYDIKDTIELTPSSDNASDYYMAIYKEGNVVKDGWITGMYSISASTLGYGDYSVWVSAKNSVGVTDSNHLDFSVVGAATYTGVHVSQNIYFPDEMVSISVDTICAKGQVIGIDKIGTGRIITEECENTYTVSAGTLGAGEYSAYFSVYNGSGGIDTERVSFKIYDKSPTWGSLEIINSESTYYVNDTITLQATSDYATEYWLGIDKDSKRLVTEEMKNGLYSFIPSEPGQYSAYVSVANKLGGLDSKCIYFTIYKDVVVNFNANEGSCPTLSKNITYGQKYGDLPVPTRNGYTFDGWYTASEGGTKIISDIIVTALENHTLYAHWTRSYGDINSDGQQSVLDAVILQKYPLKQGNFTKEQFDGADINQDGKVNVFDLILLKKKLLNVWLKNLM